MFYIFNRKIVINIKYFIYFNFVNIVHILFKKFIINIFFMQIKRKLLSYLKNKVNFEIYLKMNFAFAQIYKAS